MPRRPLFTLVSRDTREGESAHHRKLFLTEQGYSYQVRLADPTVPPQPLNAAG